MNDNLPTQRFLQTLHIVSKEGQHLIYSYGRLDSYDIDAGWVVGLENNPQQAEQLEAFISRFGRMQDTIADRLLPRWLIVLAEKPGSQIEVLQRAEKLEILSDTESWLQARKLRNRLVHEYMEDADQFAEDLLLAKQYCALLIDCFNRVCEFAAMRMDNIMDGDMPEKLSWKTEELERKG